jgi:hypothetical protein
MEAGSVVAPDEVVGRAAEVAAFEACMLVRCTGTAARGTRVRGGWPGGGFGGRLGPGRGGHGPLAEFSRPEPADRLAELLGRLGRTASVHPYAAGNRHRYEISQVYAASDTCDLLERGWRQGYAVICGHPDRPRPAQHAQLLSAAAWRAMLLVSGPTRANAPGLRVADLETAAVLVRSGRTLRVPVQMSVRPGGQLLLVVSGDWAAAPTGARLTRSGSGARPR